MDYYKAHKGNAALTCRHFGISRQSFYRRKRRYNPWDLTRLKARGVLKEPLRAGVSTRKRQWKRPTPCGSRGTSSRQTPRMSLPCQEYPDASGFTVRNVVSRWDVLEAHTRATATTAAGFLDALQSRMPFPVRAVQVDGGSEFQDAFETECQRRGLRLFVLPPRSPKPVLVS